MILHAYLEPINSALQKESLQVFAALCYKVKGAARTFSVFRHENMFFIMSGKHKAMLFFHQHKNK